MELVHHHKTATDLFPDNGVYKSMKKYICPGVIGFEIWS